MLWNIPNNTKTGVSKCFVNIVQFCFWIQFKLCSSKDRRDGPATCITANLQCVHIRKLNASYMYHIPNIIQCYVED